VQLARGVVGSRLRSLPICPLAMCQHSVAACAWEDDLPAFVAFWLSKRTCASRSAICLWASRAMEEWSGRSKPQCGQHPVFDMVSVTMVVVDISIRVENQTRTQVRRCSVDAESCSQGSGEKVSSRKVAVLGCDCIGHTRLGVTLVLVLMHDRYRRFKLKSKWNGNGNGNGNDACIIRPFFMLSSGYVKRESIRSIVSCSWAGSATRALEKDPWRPTLHGHSTFFNPLPGAGLRQPPLLSCTTLKHWNIN